MRERGPPEHAHLRDDRRAQPRPAALALHRLDQRRLLAADVGARAAAQLDGGQAGHGRVGEERGEFLLEQRARRVVLVAQVDPDALDAHRPGRDEHAFEHAVRVRAQQLAVLHRADLAFVDVHHHVARRGLGSHALPLARGREAGAAEAAQAGGLDLGHHRFARALAAVAGREQRIAAAFAVGRQAHRLGQRARRGIVRRRGGHHALLGGVSHLVLADAGGGRLVAAPDARRLDDAHAGGMAGVQREAKLIAACHLARQTGAHANREPGHGCGVVDDVEVVIEGGDFVDLGLRELQVLRQRGEVAAAQRADAVLQAMQVFDEQVAARCEAVAGGADGIAGDLVDLPALRRGARAEAQGGFLHRGSIARVKLPLPLRREGLGRGMHQAKQIQRAIAVVRAVALRHADIGATKVRAGRPRRARAAVGPAGRLPGLVRCRGRAVHLAPRAARAAHDAGESVHEACTECTPPPAAHKPGASHARRGRPARTFADTLRQRHPCLPLPLAGEGRGEGAASHGPPSPAIGSVTGKAR